MRGMMANPYFVSCFLSYCPRAADSLSYLRETISHFLLQQCLRRQSNLRIFKQGGGRCNVSAACPCPHCVSLFFLFCCGLTFTFIFSESGESAGVCYTTLRSIKSPLCCSPNVSQTKKKKKKGKRSILLSVWFSSSSADWCHFKIGVLVILQKLADKWQGKCFHSVYSSWIGLLRDLRRGAEDSGSGQDPTPSVWLNKIRPCHCIPPLHIPDRIKYSWAAADS